MKTAMSNHVNNYLILFSLLLAGCQQQENKRYQKIPEISKIIIGENEYEKIHKQVSDSLEIWKEQKVSSYESIWHFNYRLDNILCFNSERDRMVTCVLIQCNKSECSMDNISYLYGAKIKNQWHFFRGGGTMAVPREHYQKDIHTPVSFEKLHELAMEEMLRGYIKKDKKDTWQINDAFFKAHFEGVNWGDFKRYQDTVVHGPHFANKKDYFESIYLRKSQRKWQHKAK